MQISRADRPREEIRRTPLPLGYEVFQLKGQAVYDLRARLCAMLGFLEEYDSENFTEDHFGIAKRFHDMQEWKDVIRQNAHKLKQVVGERLLFQKTPYLRIARPNKPEDNIGIHRDTDYGASKDEWVLWFPLTDAVNGGELRILPGSHLREYETTEGETQADKGSTKHWLGFRYAPRRLTSEVERQCVPLSCPVGWGILFNCACVHGQIVNQAPWTRFSVDCRLVDERADYQAVRGMHGEIYSLL